MVRSPKDLERMQHEKGVAAYRAMVGPNEWTMTGVLKGWDVRSRLPELDVPTLVVRGRYDMCSDPIARTLVDGIRGAVRKGAQVSVIARMAHENGALIMVDAAQALARHRIDVKPFEDPEHIDFVAVRKGEKVTVDVAVLVTGESAPGTIHVVETQSLSLEADATALPESVTSVAVLDRTKEPGALGEPLYTDVIAALAEYWPTKLEALDRGF